MDSETENLQTTTGHPLCFPILGFIRSRETDHDAIVWRPQEESVDPSAKDELLEEREHQDVCMVLCIRDARAQQRTQTWYCETENGQGANRIW